MPLQKSIERPSAVTNPKRQATREWLQLQQRSQREAKPRRAAPRAFDILALPHPKNLLELQHTCHPPIVSNRNSRSTPWLSNHADTLGCESNHVRFSTIAIATLITATHAPRG